MKNMKIGILVAILVLLVSGIFAYHNILKEEIVTDQYKIDFIRDL